jgi:hypothetical protein
MDRGIGHSRSQLFSLAALRRESYYSGNYLSLYDARSLLSEYTNQGETDQ